MEDKKFDFKNSSEKEFKAECDRIATKMGDINFAVRKEFKHLHKMFQEGEQLLGVASGVMGGNTWLISLTDRRIIFLDKGLIYGVKQFIIPLDRISTVSGKTGIMFGSMEIATSGKTCKIKNVFKNVVMPFTNKVQETLDQVKKSGETENKNVSGPGGTGQADKYEALEKLGSLMEKGLISKEEFEEEKKKLLGDG